MSLLKIHAFDNVAVALQDYSGSEVLCLDDRYIKLGVNGIKAKHKIATSRIEKGGRIIMYGITVGIAKQDIEEGEWINTFNTSHATDPILNTNTSTDWSIPDISAYRGKTFDGYHREDGKVGTANYWIVLPLVFCENRNLEIMKEALVEHLGYGKKNKYRSYVSKVLSGLGKTNFESQSHGALDSESENSPFFKNIDGIKFLNHDMGCGGTRQDAQALCGLLAGYITNPNVCGATVFSLGCQNAQFEILEAEIEKRGGLAGKQLIFIDQQIEGTEEKLIKKAIYETILGLEKANFQTRQPAPLSKLCVGLECGASDGFSGISANPALGYASDLLVALGASVILAEFPELCGVEQSLASRCIDPKDAQRFLNLMETYADRAKQSGSGFEMNPSPGNIKDGLITDAMKSAGAAKKGGTSPIVAVLDYPEPVIKPGLNLLCTPGNDVESSTAEVGSGANLIVFTTGLGTPTGNPIVPVIKVSTNTALAEKMPDIIDIDTGGVIKGEESIEEAGKRMLDCILSAASGNLIIKSVINEQNDFIPWKRGISL
jgi:altronate hydrolase